MTADGPEGFCVVLRTDGSIEEIKLDTSPRKREAERVLKHPCTMLGEWDEQQVVLIARSDYEEPNQSLSAHKLQPPFHNFTVHGDVLLMKLGDDSTPEDYRRSEYEEFQKLVIDEWEIASDEEDEEEDGDEDDEGECC